jgi:hypothetical protein
MLAVKDKRQQIRSGQSRQAAAVLQSSGRHSRREQPAATKDARKGTICTRTTGAEQPR